MDGAPVRGDKALKADLVTENLGQSGFVAAGESAVEAVVRTHDRGDVSLPYGCIEWGDIDFMQRLVVDVRAGSVRVVADEVLDLGHDVLRLNPLDFGNAHLTGQEWVLAKCVVATTEFEVAVDIHKGLQRDINAKRAVFAADDHSIVLGRLAVEGCGHTHGGGFTLRGMAGEHARRPVRKAQAWDTEAGNSPQITCLCLVHSWILVCAVNQCQLFIECHLAQQLVDSGVTGD